MADIIELQPRIAERDFDPKADPCRSCVDQPYCSDTCDEAETWWELFAKYFKEVTGCSTSTLQR